MPNFSKVIGDDSCEQKQYKLNPLAKTFIPNICINNNCQVAVTPVAFEANGV